jgi:hypothetical protein
MEAASTSEMSVNFYQTTWRTISEDSHLHVIIYNILNIAAKWYNTSTTWRPAILIEVFHGCPQSHEASAGMVSYIRPQPLHFISFPIHDSLIILSFDAVYSEVLTAF